MKIAVLGIGMMGLPMAKRLCGAGHAVQAWNRSRAKAEPLQAEGATVHDHAADAVRGAELVITMLENGSTVEEVLFVHGVAGAMAPAAWQSTCRRSNRPRRATMPPGWPR